VSNYCIYKFVFAIRYTRINHGKHEKKKNDSRSWNNNASGYCCSPSNYTDGHDTFFFLDLNTTFIRKFCKAHVSNIDFPWSYGNFGLALGVWIVAAWRLSPAAQACYRKKLAMRFTLVLWLIALILGFMIYINLYAAVLVLK